MSRSKKQSTKEGPAEPLAVTAGSAFVRERRYIVIKIQDANEYLTKAELKELNELAEWCAEKRRANGKRALECVVVESDWPEYEPTWAAIEARCTRSPLPQRPHSLIGGNWDVDEAHTKAGFPENR